jgi:tetratricopeptide (TPR) repeat protein
MRDAPPADAVPGSKKGSQSRIWFAAVLVVLAGLAVFGIVRHFPKPPPRDPAELLSSARAHWSSGQLDKAAAELNELSRSARPASVAERLLRAQVAKERGKLDEAVAALEGVPDSDPDAGLIWRSRGLLEFERNRAQAAETALLHALTLNPDLPEARRGLIDLYAIQGRKADLVTQFKALARSGKLSFDDLYLWCLGRRNDVGPADLAAKLEAMLQNDPDDRTTRLALAENHRRLGKLAEAQADLASFSVTDPVARAALARLAIDRGSVEEAERLLAEGPADDPGLARLRGRLALGRGDASAAVHYKLALAALPDDHDTLFGLGQSLNLKGEAAAAKPYLEAARAREHLEWLIQNARSSLQRDDPKILSAIGDACWSLGRFPEAQGWFRLALARDPLASDVQKRLFELDAKLKEAAK